MIVRYGMGDLDPNAILPPSRDTLDFETDKLVSAIKQLGSDWFNSDDNVADQTTLTAWNNYVSEVNRWDWSPRALSHMLGTTWRDELLAYQVKFNQFLSSFQAANVATSVPAFTFTAAAPSTIDKLVGKVTDPIASTASTIKYVAIGGAALAAAWIFYLTFETGRTARALGPVALGVRR